MNKKPMKNQDSKKTPISSRKQNRKSENPTRIPPLPEPCSGSRCLNTWICRNSACRAVLSVVDTFCKRCSCCICHLFDDNKDPSLWLECASNSTVGESCGSSCHVECALQRGKAGVVDLGQLMQLDGSYCCASCGKISGILGYWKKQLNIAKEARRVDSLCYRIYLSFRLFDGTLRFQELHEIVKDAKTKLETEVGPLSGVSAKMARGIASRLSVAGEVQALCNAAIQKADEVSAALILSSLDGKEGSLPAACKFIFEEVTSSSVVLVLIELQTLSSNDVIGFKLWYSKSTEAHSKDPVSTFPRSQRRILISNLQPCTEYSFTIVSYTKSGDLGHSEAKCFTKSVEIHTKNLSPAIVPHNEGTSGAKDDEPDPGFKVRDLGKVLRIGWVEERPEPTKPDEPGSFGLDPSGSHGLDQSGSRGLDPSGSVGIDPSSLRVLDPPASRGLDLNIVSVPDLNEELAPPIDSDHGSGGGGSENWANHGPPSDVAAVDSRKRRASTEIHDCDSALVNMSPLAARPGCFDESFEYCVKTIRMLECHGYIKQEFRLKLLTWFSLRSTEQERRVVNTFIRTLRDDPSSLAGQLIDTFSDIVNNKKPRNGFCSKLWH